MPRNGTGTMVRTNGNFQGSQVWQNQSQAADRRITSPQHDTHDEDIASELTNSLPRDGQAAMTGILDAGGFRVRNVGAPVDVSDAIRRGDSFELSSSDLASGSSVDFTLESWAKEIIVLPERLQTDGTLSLGVQLGIGSGIIATGYVGSCGNIGVSSVSSIQYPGTRFQLENGRNASDPCNGVIRIYLQNSDAFFYNLDSSLGFTASVQRSWSTGSIQLNEVATTVRLECQTDTFNGGRISVLQKG